MQIRIGARYNARRERGGIRSVFGVQHHVRIHQLGGIRTWLFTL